MALERCAVEEITWRGWPAICLANGVISVVTVPLLGGRIMAYDLGPLTSLFVNPVLAGRLFSAAGHQGDGSLTAWKNYGGDKTWPAPQGWDGPDQWPGPPDNVLDSGPYAAEILPAAADGAVGVQLTSAPDERTGLRIVRTLRLWPNSAEAALDVQFVNVVDRPVRWAIWDVTQLDCASAAGGPSDGCWLTLPGAADGYRVLFGLDHDQWRASRWPDLLAVHYGAKIGKIGAWNAGGWLAFSHAEKGLAFTARYPALAGHEYPDGGVNTECWTEATGEEAPLPYHSVGHLLEAEVLGPLVRLQPGERSRLDVRWGLARTAGPVLAVTDAGCLSEPLSATWTAGWLRVRLQAGLFLVGTAQLVLVAADEGVLATIELGPVSPLAHLALDRLVAAPTPPARLRVLVSPASGGPPRLLAEANVHDGAGD